MDDEKIRKLASEDPQDFVRHGDDLMIIDEVQKVPELISAIKMDVDRNTKPGRFLLTGSSNIHANPMVAESLAGRMATFQLKPFVSGEIHGRENLFLKKAFSKGTFSEGFEDMASTTVSKTAKASQFLLDSHVLKTFFYSKEPLGTKEFLKKDYMLQAFCGGFPEALHRSSLDEIRIWHKDYVEALLARDLRDISNIRRKNALLRLLKTFAIWSSRPINLQKIGRQLSSSLEKSMDQETPLSLYGYPRSHAFDRKSS